MVMFEVQNRAPPYSNQTPVGPGMPWPKGASILQVPQMIKTATVHNTPSIDNYAHARGVAQHIRTRIRPGRGPDSYDALDFTVQTTRGSPPFSELQEDAPMPIWGSRGVPQQIKTGITSGAGPDSYKRSHVRRMSYGADAGSILGGLIVGFIIGGIVFTATGKHITSEVATAASRRVSSYITPR
jgi:hypothetical protein